jgi:hypothetical protein
MNRAELFSSLYFELKVEFPGCTEEYYHRAINKRMEWKCEHPFPLLRITNADGVYLVDYVSRIRFTMLTPEDQLEELRKWFKNPLSKAQLWCSVCQTCPYPYEEPCIPGNPITHGINFAQLDVTFAGKLGTIVAWYFDGRKYGRLQDIVIASGLIRDVIPRIVRGETENITACDLSLLRDAIGSFSSRDKEIEVCYEWIKGRLLIKRG